MSSCSGSFVTLSKKSPTLSVMVLPFAGFAGMMLLTLMATIVLTHHSDCRAQEPTTESNATANDRAAGIGLTEILDLLSLSPAEYHLQLRLLDFRQIDEQVVDIVARMWEASKRGENSLILFNAHSEASDAMRARVDRKERQLLPQQRLRIKRYLSGKAYIQAEGLRAAVDRSIRLEKLLTKCMDVSAPYFASQQRVDFLRDHAGEAVPALVAAAEQHEHPHQLDCLYTLRTTFPETKLSAELVHQATARYSVADERTQCQIIKVLAAFDEMEEALTLVTEKLSPVEAEISAVNRPEEAESRKAEVSKLETMAKERGETKRDVIQEYLDNSGKKIIRFFEFDANEVGSVLVKLVDEKIELSKVVDDPTELLLSAALNLQQAREEFDAAAKDQFTVYREISFQTARAKVYSELAIHSGVQNKTEDATKNVNIAREALIEWKQLTSQLSEQTAHDRSQKNMRWGMLYQYTAIFESTLGTPEAVIEAHQDLLALGSDFHHWADYALVADAYLKQSDYRLAAVNLRNHIHECIYERIDVRDRSQSQSVREKELKRMLPMLTRLWQYSKKAGYKEGTSNCRKYFLDLMEFAN